MEYEIVRRVVAEVLQIGEEEIRPESLLTTRTERRSIRNR